MIVCGTLIGFIRFIYEKKSYFLYNEMRALYYDVKYNYSLHVHSQIRT
jgi:hypothetical protein